MIPSSRRSNRSSGGTAATDHYHRFPISEIEVVHHHECDLEKLPLDPFEHSPVASMSEKSSTISTCTDSTDSSSRPQNEEVPAVVSAQTETKKSKTKKVSFDRNVVMRYHIHLNDMTPFEIESSFVSHSEFSRTRHECDAIRSLLDEQEAVVLHSRDDPEGSSSSYDSSSTNILDRGIRTTSRCHLVTACRRRAVKEVLEAQEQSWYQFHQNNDHQRRHEESDGACNRHSNVDGDLQEYYDLSVDLIARSYRRVIRLCRSEIAARQIGLQDQLEASKE